MAAALIALVALLLLAPRAAEANCYDTGAGVGYRGNWYALSHADRTARCLEAERRQQERQDRQREREAAREERAQPPAGGSAPEADRRAQECLVNADACAMPGSSGGAAGGEPTRPRRGR